MSRADRPIPDRDSAPNSASSRRTAHGTPGNDDVPYAGATTGPRSGLAPGPTPEVRIPGPRTRPGQAQGLLRYVYALRPPAFCPPQSRQGDRSLGLETLQQLTALVILQSAV